VRRASEREQVVETRRVVSEIEQETHAAPQRDDLAASESVNSTDFARNESARGTSNGSSPFRTTFPEGRTTVPTTAFARAIVGRSVTPNSPKAIDVERGRTSGHPERHVVVVPEEGHAATERRLSKRDQPRVVVTPHARDEPSLRLCEALGAPAGGELDGPLVDLGRLEQPVDRRHQRQREAAGKLARHQVRLAQLPPERAGHPRSRLLPGGHGGAGPLTLLERDLGHGGLLGSRVPSCMN
jgi:hypothetical protein